MTLTELRLDIIIRAVCYATKKSREEIFSNKRTEDIVFARFVIINTFRTKLNLSFVDTGRILGIHRANVHHAKKVIESEIGRKCHWMGLFDAMVGEIE